MGRAAFRAYILAVSRRREERQIINSVMRRLCPGKHFIGLWIYRQKNHRTVTPLWTCTLWGLDGQYYETPLRRTAYAAIRDMERELWADPSGKEGRRAKKEQAK